MSALRAYRQFERNAASGDKGSEQAFAAASTNVVIWHNPDLRLAVSEGPLTIAFRTLATEGMRPGLQGLTGLYGALVLLARFAGAAGKPFPSGKRPRDRSPGEALGGAWVNPAVHRGEVIQHIADVRASMSVYRRIPDAVPSGAEGRSLTRNGHSAYSRFHPGADIRCHSISYPPSNGGIHLNLLSDFPRPPLGCSSLGGGTVI